MKILSIHDIAGFGRSSLTTIISALSAHGHQCIPAPTAVFSTHLGFQDVISHDLSDILDDYINHYAKLELKFDCIYSGFLSSDTQIDSVIKSFEKFPNALRIVDPVTGDNGKVYKTYTPKMCEKMKYLVKFADIITPNITEAKILLDMDLNQEIKSEEEVKEIISKLLKFGEKKIIITGLNFDKKNITTAFYENEVVKFYKNPKIDEYFPGTGDLFASILIGYLLKNENLEESVKKSADFVYEAIKYTKEQQTENMHGVLFEKFLYKLAKD